MRYVLAAVLFLAACGQSTPALKCDDSAEMTKYINECNAAGDGSNAMRTYCACNWNYMATRFACDANPPASDAIAACRECSAKAGLTCPY